uniref:Uncharacterized protein n=1 Tax=Laticauda laticaudata TaxID=8630 RepID=A0A8C5WP02_LATLA
MKQPSVSCGTEFPRVSSFADWGWGRWFHRSSQQACIHSSICTSGVHVHLPLTQICAHSLDILAAQLQTPPTAQELGTLCCKIFFPSSLAQNGQRASSLRKDAGKASFGGRSCEGEDGGFPGDSGMRPRVGLRFAGNMERQQTDNLLKQHASGTYLIRERPAEAERFAISIKFNDEVKHIKVVEKDNWIHITEAKKFESLLELVEYYQAHSLKESFKQLDTTLKYPYKSRERSASRTLARSPGKDFFTPRAIGTAVARYNFAARDMRELSLQEGDVVKIYSRIGGDQGWWKGEANGRIGWFPSTYVEEEGVQ